MWSAEYAKALQFQTHEITLFYGGGWERTICSILEKANYVTMSFFRRLKYVGEFTKGYLSGSQQYETCMF